ESAKVLLANQPEITALFAISDIMAIGAGKAISDGGLKIGEDISLIGFDGLNIGEYYTPSLTTIKQPGTRMAEKSIDLLMELIEKNGSNQNIILETKLIERMSVSQIEG
ncbi:MAG: substrate-binding domain-containing protein, partial [Niameybacter sp.]